MKSRFFVSFILFIVISITEAHAQYIDPGTGSYLFQLFIAGFLGVIFYWKYIKNKYLINIFSILFKAKNSK